MNIDRRVIGILLAPVLLGGCETPGMQQALGADPTWGEANRQTMAAQVVNPEPDYTWEEMETSADHSSRAIDRYRNDAVKKPEKIKTTTVSSGR